MDIQHICEEHVTVPDEDYPIKDTSAASEEYHHFPNHPTDHGHIFEQHQYPYETSQPKHSHPQPLDPHWLSPSMLGITNQAHNLNCFLP